MSPKQFLIAVGLLVVGVAGAAYAANWSPYSATANTLAGAAYVQVYPPAAKTTQTFTPIGTLSAYTIATLPTCGSTSRGMRVYVTNGATSPTYLAAVSATGAVVVPVFCDGSGWIYN